MNCPDLDVRHRPSGPRHQRHARQPLPAATAGTAKIGQRSASNPVSNVSWSLCDCAPARAERSRGAGHLTVRCRAEGCPSVWRKPRHDPETGSWGAGAVRRPGLTCQARARAARARRPVSSARDHRRRGRRRHRSRDGGCAAAHPRLAGRPRRSSRRGAVAVTHRAILPRPGQP
jgi:hypothetical protein